MGHFSVGEKVTLNWILIQIAYEIVGWIYLTYARFRRNMESLSKSKGFIISSINYMFAKYY